MIALREQPEPARPADRPLSVLVLDDDSLLGRQLVLALGRSTALKLAGTAVSSAADALRAVREAAPPFDIFLIDQRLGPGPDGITVLQQLLALSPGSGAVVFTMAGDLASARRAHQAGAYRYLHKPFSLDELLLVIETLREWLQTRAQVSWLQVINLFAEDAQKLHSREAIERIIVQRGLDLGFDRARLWNSFDGGATLIGAACAGPRSADDAEGCPLKGFLGTVTVTAQSVYLARVVASPAPIVFEDLEHGETPLMRQRAAEGYGPPRGQWVGLPLWAGGSVRGALMLDRIHHRGTIRGDHELLQALGLFGRQVAAALERAMLSDDEQRRSLETAILAKVGRLISGDTARRPDVVLLEEVRQEIGRLVQVDSFLVAMRNERSDWVDLLINVEGGEHQRRDPVPPGRGLIHQVLVQNRPVLLPTRRSIEAFRREQGVISRATRGRQAHAWLGVPLQVEGQAVGALAAQQLSPGRSFTAEDQRILEAVAAQIAGPLHNRRLREAAEQASRRMAVIQRATEALMTLDNPTDEHLWHAAMTVVTAGFGLGYNLAVVFRLARGSTVLKGQLGIGHRSLRQAQRTWNRTRVRAMTFEQYWELLINDRLDRPSPLDEPIRTLELPLAQAGALGEAIGQPDRIQRIRVTAQDFAARLPPAIQAILPPWEYEILPVAVGRRRLGVVLTGNPYLRQPLDEMPLDQLTAWLAQVSVIYESWRQRQAGERLATISREILARAATRPLRDTLRSICESARVLMRASCAVIYPLVPGQPAGLPAFDLEQAGHDGLKHGLQPADQPGPNGVTRKLLARRTPLQVADVLELRWFRHDHPGNSFLQREGIRSFIAATIFDHATEEPRGLLYVNYRTPQGFAERDEETTAALAELAGQAIRNHDDRAVVEARVASAEAGRRKREHEQLILAELLKGTLAIKFEQPEATDRLVQLILQQGRALLGQSRIRLGLMLHLWERQPDLRRREVRREYYLANDRLKQHAHSDIYRGLAGLALKTRQDQRVDDVTRAPWSAHCAGPAASATRSELDVLIRLEGRVLGLITVESPRVAAFSAEDHAALRRLADSAALALSTSQTEQQLQGLLRAARPMIEATDLETTLKAVLEQILKIAPELDVVTIWYWDAERRAMVPGVHHGVWNTGLLVEDRALLPNTVLGRVLLTPEPIWSEEATSDPFMAGRFVAEEAIRSSVTFPLRISDDADEDADADAVPLVLPPGADGTRRRAVGVLFLDYRHWHRFTRHERAMFPLVAAIVAACIRDALTVDQLRRQRRRLFAAISLARAVGSPRGLDETLRLMLETIHALLISTNRNIRLCVLLSDEPAERLRFASASAGFYNSQYIEDHKVLPLNGSPSSIAARVARRALAEERAAAENIGDVTGDDDYIKANEETRSQLSLALLSPDTGGLLGVLVIEADQPHAFSRDDELLVEGLSTIISLAIKGARENQERRFNAAVAGVTAWMGETAHDIGTIITDIRHALYRHRMELGEDQAERLNSISESLSRLSSLTSAPLRAAGPFDLNAWLRVQVPRIAARRAGPPVAVDFALAAELLQVSVPEVLLERVFGHLIRNARRVQPKGCVIAIRSLRNGQAAQILISNNGPAIPPEVRERLFIERIEHPDRATGEGGMGLLLSRWVMRSLGGDIALVSDHNPVTFGLWLPLAERSAQ